MSAADQAIEITEGTGSFKVLRQPAITSQSQGVSRGAGGP